ncbi:hypothetical protein GCM10007971_00980 [Oceanobacillus indicireducens]|uniref:Type II secretion system protein M n=2 Tax=Oceanobacillus indicireducens TaxID=1004261 RepID=A0A918CY71_9BACI|nr:hypothetical protein GCM10007971_00980 [Oceanobacillus indicireducens]
MKQLFQENRNTFLLLLALLFILIFSVYFFLYRPLAADLQQVESQEKGLKDEVVVLEEEIDTISESAEKSNKDLEQLRLMNELPASPELDEFLLTLNEIELISNSGIDEMFFEYQGDLPDRDSTGEEESEEATDIEMDSADESGEILEVEETELLLELEEMPIGLEPIIVTMDIQSPDYEHFQLFLKEIENQERIIVVPSLEFDKPAESEAVFNQSANQNRTSKAVIDATYLAQMQLENVYSKSLSFKNYEAAFADLGYTYTYEANDWVHFLHTGHDSYPEFYTEIKIKNKQDDDLYHVVVMVYQKSDDSLQAMMQNIVLWEQSEP